MDTLEKEQYFAQYWKQDVIQEPNFEDTIIVNKNTIEHNTPCWLLLTDLKNISDEDAVNVAKMSVVLPITVTAMFSC